MKYIGLKLVNNTMNIEIKRNMNQYIHNKTQNLRITLFGIVLEDNSF